MKILIIILFLGLTQCVMHSKYNDKNEKPPQSSQEAAVDRAEIKKTISSHKGYMSRCYGQALMGKGSAKLTGTLFVGFTIGPDGKATAPHVIPEKTTIKSETLEKCLFAGITSWDFPAHPEGIDMDIRYPFVFSDRPPAGMQKTMDKFQSLRRE